MKKTCFFTLLFLFLAIAFSCNKCNNGSSTDHLKDVKLDTSDTVHIKVHRYDKALFAVDLKNMKQDLTGLLPEYSLFITDSLLNDSVFLYELKSYLTFPLNIDLFSKSMELYPDLSGLEAQLNDAFSLYKHYFPKKKVPELYTYISGLDDVEPVYYADSVMIVFLDWYLGSDYPYYSGISAYVKKKLRKEFILPDCMRAIGMALADSGMSKKTFLDYIINEGKILYFMDATLPEVPDSIKMYYSPAQLQWCIDNEANIWSYIVERKLLYSTDAYAIRDLCQDGPFTKVFSKESPSRTGLWIGWQIVRKYMKEKKDVSLAELLKSQDSQDILTKSKYKPKK